MKALFDEVSVKCSRVTTHTYSTSFSLGIQFLGQNLRDPIYSIYGFVRFADEIVDSFHGYDKALLLKKFRQDTTAAISDRISLNPILNSFQQTVHTYHIDHRLIEAFLHSMEMDLSKTSHNDVSYEEYILGSAEVVGLMCLKVFCHEKPTLFDHLSPFAMKLGAAFQKVNFLRDLQADYQVLGRCYFPGIEMGRFDDDAKRAIEQSIAEDFNKGFQGIKLLPRSSRLGVYIAYVYYLALFKKIRNTPSAQVMKKRIRIANRHKATLLAYSYVKHRLNRI